MPRIIVPKVGRVPTTEDLFKKLSKVNREKINYCCERLKELADLSENTVRTYRFYTIHLLTYCKKDYTDVTEEDVENFFILLRKKGLNNRTGIENISFKSIISGLNTFFRCFGRNDLVITKETSQGKNLFLRGKKITQPVSYGSRIFQKDEIVKLYKACKAPTTLKPLRYYNKLFLAMITLAYESALRISEDINLRIEDVDRIRRTVTVRRSKTSKVPQTVEGLSKNAIKVLEEYLQSNQFIKPENGNKERYLFPIRIKFGQRKGEVVPIYETLVDKLLRQVMHIAGIPKSEKTFHSFRHSSASHKAADGWSPPDIRDFMRHKQGSNTVMLYLHPLKKKKDSSAGKLLEGIV